MRSLSSITIDTRLQAVVIYLSAVLYISLMLLGDRAMSLPNLVLLFVGFVLPWLSTLLALSILGSCFRRKERCRWWVQLAVLVGLAPWIGLVVSKLAAN